MTHSTGGRTTLGTPPGALLTNEQANEQAVALARQLADGEIDGETARMSVLALIWRTRLVEEAVNIFAAKTRCSMQDRADLADQLRDIIYTCIGENRGFDLQWMLTHETTLSGWVIRFGKQTLYNIAPRFWKAKREESPADMTAVIPQSSAPEAVVDDDFDDFEDAGIREYLDGTPLDLMDDEAFAAAASRVEEATSHQRELTKTQIQRRILTELLGWPEPEHVLDPDEALRLIREVESNPQRLERTAYHLMGHEHDESAAGTVAPDPGMGRILSGLSFAQLRQGVRTPAVLREYMLAAATPRPAYGSKSVAKASTALKRLIPRDKRWATLVGDLVEAAAAFVSDRESEFSTSPDADQIKSVEQKEAESSAWTLASNAVAAYPGTPLGTDRDQMLREVCARIEEARDELSAARKQRSATAA